MNNNYNIPKDMEAEAATLGSILHDHTVMDEVADAIRSPEDFYLEKHATIYAAMQKVVERESKLDIVLLVGQIGDMGALAQVGDTDYLLELINSVPHAVNAGAYARRVAEKAARRRQVDMLERYHEALVRTDAPTASLMDRQVNEMIESSVGQQDDSGSLDFWLDQALEDEKPRVPSGLAALDGIVEGFESGSYVIVGARPSVGKTACGVTIALDMARRGVRCGFVSAEMSGKRVARRFVCAHAGVSTTHFSQNRSDPQILSAVDELRGDPLWINQAPGIHIDRACSQIRRWKREHDIQVAFVDYLQLLSSDHDNEYERVTHVSKMLNSIKTELDITIFALAQLNRANTQRPNKRPTMADLRGSGAVEQDADVILLLHRPSYYADAQDIIDGKVRDDEAEIIVEKSRDGRTDTAHVGWLPKCGVFSSGSGAEQAAAAIPTCHPDL